MTTAKPSKDMLEDLLESEAPTCVIIKAKLKGKEPHLVEHVEPQNAEIVDLMERLRQSLQGAGSATGMKKKKTARAQKTSTRARKRPHAA